MVVRRLVYRAIFPLAVALPIWVLIGRGIVADGVGWQFVVYLFIAPVLFVALMATGGLVVARPDVRAAKAVSWPDAAVLIALWLVLVASGLFAIPALAVASVLLVLGLFWLAGWELVRETQRKLREFNEGLQAASRPPAAAPLDIGEVIVVTSQPVDPATKRTDRP